jgi:hypothetical protein
MSSTWRSGSRYLRTVAGASVADRRRIHAWTSAGLRDAVVAVAEVAEEVEGLPVRPRGVPRGVEVAEVRVRSVPEGLGAFWSVGNTGCLPSAISRRMNRERAWASRRVRKDPP